MADNPINFRQKRYPNLELFARLALQNAAQKAVTRLPRTIDEATTALSLATHDAHHKHPFFSRSYLDVPAHDREAGMLHVMREEFISPPQDLTWKDKLSIPGGIFAPDQLVLTPEAIAYRRDFDNTKIVRKPTSKLHKESQRRFVNDEPKRASSRPHQPQTIAQITELLDTFPAERRDMAYEGTLARRINNVRRIPRSTPAVAASIDDAKGRLNRDVMNYVRSLR